MKRKGDIVFITACFLLCMLPSLGMLIAPTQTTMENRQLAKMPKITEEDKWNQEYLQELGEYFEDHMALRESLVMADSLVQSKLFRVSNVDSVIVGKQGWLYYRSTLEDYIGSRSLSERGIYNVANNLLIMQQYVQQRGAEYVLAIAPNKNSLYGENMPYYYQYKINANKNIDVLKPKLDKLGIVQADLYSAFSEEEETLYLKRDSHWNQKGAVLAYNTIMDALECEHETYETTYNVRTKTEYGDLNQMIYPLKYAPEWNYTYSVPYDYQYATDTQSVEEAWIATDNKNGEGSLLMFRDSFGNTLLPLLAEEFENAYFSKSEPYNIEKFMNEYNPEYIIGEKVERNISDFATNPPVMTPPMIDLLDVSDKVETLSTLEITESEVDTSYWSLEGTVEETYIQEETDVYINITTDKTSSTYEAFTLTNDVGDNGYRMYIPKTELATGNVQIEILVKCQNVVTSVLTKEFDMKEIR